LEGTNVISKMIDLISSDAPPPEGVPTDEQMEAAQDAGEEAFAELIEAAEKVSEPHLVCVLAHGGMHAWENCTEEEGNSFEDLKRIAELVVAIVSEYISDYEGEEAVTLWLAHLLCENA
jgi:hypothetical protein